MRNDDMVLEQVKGNTWVLKSWEVIPLYKLDAHRCILLDTGLADQREALEGALQEAGLTCVGILGSHAHIDHMGSHAYFQRKYGATLAMSLGEAAVLHSRLGLNLQNYNLSARQILDEPQLGDTMCLADQIILPGDDQVTLCGVTFDIIHTPGHTIDHICVRTPDHVLYLGDAIMTGRTLFKSKFPYAFSVQDYFDSLRRIRTQPADWYIAAHWGIYPEILSFVDMEARFLSRRMQEILDLVDGVITAEELTSKICQVYQIDAHSIVDLSYFERATRAYIFYLMDRGHMESFMENNVILYRRLVEKVPPEDVSGPGRDRTIPRPGSLSLQLLGLEGDR